MFTGIIKTIGIVEELANQHLAIRSELFSSKVSIGDSIAVNGVCLTVTTLDSEVATFDLAEETLRRTTFAELQVQDRVNLEDSLRVGDSLSGHFVQGHVDGTSSLVSVTEEEQSWRYVFSLPESLRLFIAEKGSITIDGISLTVGEVSKDDFSVYVIPHTRAITTLGLKSAGSRVNLEVDCLARYVVNAITLRDMD